MATQVSVFSQAENQTLSQVFDPKQELEKGVHLSEKVLTKLAEMIPKIIKWEDDDSIESLSTGMVITSRRKHDRTNCLSFYGGIPSAPA